MSHKRPLKSYSGIEYKLLYASEPSQLMDIAFFVSRGDGNMNAALNLQDERPYLICVGHVVADRWHIRVLDTARSRDIPTIAEDFAKVGISWEDCKDDPTLTRI